MILHVFYSRWNEKLLSIHIFWRRCWTRERERDDAHGEHSHNYVFIVANFPPNRIKIATIGGHAFGCVDAYVPVSPWRPIYCHHIFVRERIVIHRKSRQINRIFICGHKVKPRRTDELLLRILFIATHSSSSKDERGISDFSSATVYFRRKMLLSSHSELVSFTVRDDEHKSLTYDQ